MAGTSLPTLAGLLQRGMDDRVFLGETEADRLMRLQNEYLTRLYTADQQAPSSGVGAEMPDDAIGPWHDLGEGMALRYQDPKMKTRRSY